MLKSFLLASVVLFFTPLTPHIVKKIHLRNLAGGDVIILADVSHPEATDATEAGTIAANFTTSGATHLFIEPDTKPALRSLLFEVLPEKATSLLLTKNIFKSILESYFETPSKIALKTPEATAEEIYALIHTHIAPQIKDISTPDLCALIKETIASTQAILEKTNAAFGRHKSEALETDFAICGALLEEFTHVVEPFLCARFKENFLKAILADSFTDEAGREIFTLFGSICFQLAEIASCVPALELFETLQKNQTKETTFVIADAESAFFAHPLLEKLGFRHFVEKEPMAACRATEHDKVSAFRAVVSPAHA